LVTKKSPRKTFKCWQSHVKKKNLWWLGRSQLSLMNT
jgi:hypothetical protein